MSAVKPSTIPSKNFMFKINDLEGDQTKHAYSGDFEFKVLNLKEKAMVEKHEAFLNGDNQDNLTPDLKIFHYNLSFLKYSLTKFPDWWIDSDLGYELYDMNIIEELMSQVKQELDEWKKSVWGD